MDSGEFPAGNVTAALEFLDEFDSIFDVLRPPQRNWHLGCRSGGLIAERAAAKKTRNFARSDQIRAAAAGAGIILEDTKEGTRWKRK